jgi:hypothetical protein
MAFTGDQHAVGALPSDGTHGAGPGVSLDGNGRGCNTLTGTFTVLDAVFGRNGYVQTFDATFEQHCEGGETAARGAFDPAIRLGTL